jgi:subtilisin family serine protease
MKEMIATFSIGRAQLKLRIIGAGVRYGRLPAPDEQQVWHLAQDDLSTLEAFEAAGWRFHPQPDLRWDEATALNDGRIEPGLLARHPHGGLVILTNHVIVRLPSPDVVTPEIGDVTPVPLETNLYDVRLRVPARSLLGTITVATKVFNQAFALDGGAIAEPLLMYHVVHPGSVVQITTNEEIQEHWKTIKLAAAWEKAKTRGADTRVAVIDCGFHTDDSQLRVVMENTAFVDSSGRVGFAKKLNGKIGYVTSDGTEIAPEMPKVPHGTACAGLVGATLDNKKVHGAAPECELMLVGVECVTSTLAVANAIKICVDGIQQGRGAHVISGSIGPVTGIWDFDNRLEPAVEHAHKNGRDTLGVPIVWASFNEDELIPSNSLEAHVICVSASRDDDQRVQRSGYGPALDLLAPGTGVTVLKPSSGGGAAAASGSSCAAPMVAGVAALVLSTKPTLKLTQVINVIRLSCDPDIKPKVHAPTIGFGRLNALRTIENIP